MIISFFFLGLLFWFIDSIVDFTYFNDEGESFIEVFLYFDTFEYYIRSIYVFLFTVMGLIMQKSLSKQKKLESDNQENINKRLNVLTGGFSHNFNNLIGLIMGYTSFILSEMSHDNEFRSNVKEIENAAIKAAKLTHKMQFYAGDQVFTYTECNVKSLIQGLDETFTNHLNNNQKITYHLAPDMPLVKFNEKQIRNVILELILNAIDSTEDDGKISLSSRVDNVASHEIMGFTTSSYKMTKGKYLVLSISDNGAGIHNDIISKVFDPFFTTKFRDIGTGLSLSKVQGIIIGHDGAINIKTKYGEGTSFEVYLPLRS